MKAHRAQKVSEDPAVALAQALQAAVRELHAGEVKAGVSHAREALKAFDVAQTKRTKQARPKPAPKPTRATVDEPALRRALEAALRGGQKLRTIAKSIGFADSTALSRWRHGNGSLAAEKLLALHRFLHTVDPRQLSLVE